MQSVTDYVAPPVAHQLESERATSRVLGPRHRVPLRGVLAVAGAWLWLFLTVVIGAGSLALIPLLAPVFVVFILGGASLAASALEYARRSRR